MAYAHRVAYESRVGPIPAGFVIDHLCSNRLCCNPAHLEPVTQGTNLERCERSISTINAAKTHCPKGHPYSPENTYVGKYGTRFCRTCNRESKRARKARAAGQ